jgi:hypothetical protein
MTVKREKSEIYDDPLPEVLKTTRAILARGQTGWRYEDTVESEGGRVIDTVRKTSRGGVLSTRMQIRIHAFESKTKVVVETTSPWFVFGDAADFYGDYIQDLLGSIGSGIGQEIGGMAPQPEEQAKVPMKLFYWVNSVCVILILSESFIARLFIPPFTPSNPVQDIQRLIDQAHLRMVIGIVPIMVMVGFNLWWRNKYFQDLDPRMQKSMNYGRGAGMRIGLVLCGLGLLYIVLKFFIKI